MLPAMRYKTFTWPHNPKTYLINFTRNTAVQKVPMGEYVLQDLGRTCREMRGEGEFYGADAYDAFRELAAVFYDSGPGTLLHPVWQTSSAYFTKLELKQEPRENYVAYSFVFREGFDGYAGMTKLPSSSTASASTSTAASTGTVCHTVTAGETMWGISRDYGLTLAELLALNPGIANPNRISVGQKVRVK